MPRISLPFVTAKEPLVNCGDAAQGSGDGCVKPSPLPTPTPSAPAAGRRIVIDPLTRIEGHLRMEVQVADGQVTDAWSAGTMFRGIEIVLQGRDPREAWLMTQRICGVCTTVHALASVRAVENALGITVPQNAHLLRNLIEGAQFIQDHVIHFYHLHALDWVDPTAALAADPAATAALGRSISPWPSATTERLTTVKTRLAAMVSSGQLGLFANGFWGHPAYRLSPEANLLLMAHYLEALEWQRDYIRIHATLGGKNPHPQSYLVGGMSLPVGTSGRGALTPQRIDELRALSDQGLTFVQQVLLPDLGLVAGAYPEWFQYGGGYGNMLSYGDFGLDLAHPWLPAGVLWRDLYSAGAQPLDTQAIREYVAHSWYDYGAGDRAGLKPTHGETNPHYTGPTPPYDALDTSAKYSWLKAPRYDEQPMEVGPLARLLVAYHSGHARIRTLVDGWLDGQGRTHAELNSTMGRMAARGLETLAIAEQMGVWLDKLKSNIQSGNVAIHNGTRWEPSTWPTQAAGYGLTEAPRGGLGHWVGIENGKIAHYQAVVPTTWNGSPRDAQGQRGVWEQALVGIPVSDPDRPLEVLRTVHSFDPCMACAVHVLDGQRRELTRIEMLTF